MLCLCAENIRTKSKGLFIIKNISYTEPVISVIVRTCGRPTVLEECLNSIQNQTFRDFEVCIAEDGQNISEDFIKNKFPTLRYKYIATIEKKGRSIAGNYALSMAHGKYFTFLDDDDIIYENHLKTMIETAMSNPEGALFYTKAYQTPIKVNSLEPYKYELTDSVYVQQPVYTRSALTAHNLFPIQTVLFKRELYDKYGGFDSSYEYLEDWELWLRYSQNNDFIEINSFTSEYRVPAAGETSAHRKNMLKANEEKIRLKYITTQKADIKNYKLINTQQFKYKIDDSYMISENILYVNGWGFHKKENTNTEIYILITDKSNQKQLYTTENHFREDVSQIYPETQNQSCGFTSFINIDKKNIKSVDIIMKHGQLFYYNKFSHNPLLIFLKKLLRK